nr:CBS domain-containing protein [Betaproteobacteria bacterium]
EALISVSPGADALGALAILGQRDLNQLAVIEQGRLVGLIRREDVLKWLSLHGGAELDESAPPAARAA